MWPKRSLTSFQLATIEVGPQKIPFVAMHDAALKNVFHVDQECDGQHQGAEFVKEKNGAESAHAGGELARPEALAEAHGQPRGRQTEKGGEQGRVHIPLRAREAHEVAAVCGGLRCCGCLLQLRHPFLHLPPCSSSGCSARGSATEWCES